MLGWMNALSIIQVENHCGRQVRSTHLKRLLNSSGLTLHSTCAGSTPLALSTSDCWTALPALPLRAGGAAAAAASATAVAFDVPAFIRAFFTTGFRLSFSSCTTQDQTLTWCGQSQTLDARQDMVGWCCYADDEYRSVWDG